MSRELRIRILFYLDDHARTNSGEYVADSTLAQALSASVKDIDRQLAILEEQGLVRPANSKDGRRALISPNGILTVEEFREAASQPPRRPIGFRPNNE